MGILGYIAANWSTLGPQTATHLQIVAIAIAISAVVGIGTGILAARWQPLASVALFITSLLLTIPSFALFGVLAIWLGIGSRPVELGLILYALLPILRNTRVGILAIDPAVVEAARGMGMRPVQVLLSIELPLAVPLIVAGLRQSTVMVVAIATVGAVVGANDLGQPILFGLRGSDRTAIYSGVIPVAVMGVLADALFAALQRFLQRGRLAVETA